MKGLLIGLGVSLGIATAYAAKKINDDRQELTVQDGDLKIVTIESFKQAAKRKVNEIKAWVSFKKAVKEKVTKILNWVNANNEKVESMVKTAGIITTALGIISAAIDLYSSARSLVKNPDEELLREVDEIRLRLIYLTPDVQCTHF